MVVDYATRLGRELDKSGMAGHSFADRLAAVLAEHAGLLIEFECPGLPDIPEPVTAACCGATSEALTNVRKHAHADRARVTVHTAGGLLTVTIADEGIAELARMIRVAIIDDHPLYRHGLAMAVEQAEDFTLMADAASIKDFDRLNVTADLVLLDLQLPGIEGAAGVAHVCAREPKVIASKATGKM